MSTIGLRRFLQRPPPPAPGEQCEMCAEPIVADHGHVIDLGNRSILCTCRGCYLLFTHTGAGGGRHRAVPERYLHVADFPAGSQLWEATGIPVRMAFMFHNSSLESTVAFYPSPAGATESLLPQRAWDDILAGSPTLGDIQDDVEALLVNRVAHEDFECFLVPIDACYGLVGLVRLYWKGFDGGTEAWEHIDSFFADLRERSEPVTADG